jgi:hypothetical protein
MSKEHHVHESHSHTHGDNCGHKKVKHADHTDYLHDGHLHNIHEGHVDEHHIEVTSKNPADCTPDHKCEGHDANHKHGANCGHEAIPHGDHTDYLVKGHLHHSHNGHCDDHGQIAAS